MSHHKKPISSSPQRPITQYEANSKNVMKSPIANDYDQMFGMDPYDTQPHDYAQAGQNHQVGGG